MKQNKKSAENHMDWEHRILCSDESCIGVIGANGKCGECGSRYKGQLPETFKLKVEDKTQPSENETLVGNNLLEPEQSAEPRDSDEADSDVSEDQDSDWENRILCSDESCIGVIGPDGKCKECGKLHEDTQK